jgi:beta-phosphoglucomutase family hydrolase
MSAAAEAMKSNLLSRHRFDAVLFDLDGVLTATAKVHAACWKRMFDEYLRLRELKRGEEFRAFDIQTDYKTYVDGKPRYDGVRDFLKSRSIDLPEGKADDPPTAETVCGLGNRKNNMINDVLESEGVEPYEGSVLLVQQLRRQGMKTAVVSSSQNCLVVLQAAKMADLFDTRVDGEVAGRLDLRGKPAPDTFLAAATSLGVSPLRAVVVEDAISGVQAGRAGRFGLVIGVARKGEGDALKENGADVVVADLGELVQDE